MSPEEEAAIVRRAAHTLQGILFRNQDGFYMFKKVYMGTNPTSATFKWKFKYKGENKSVLVTVTSPPEELP